MTFQILTPKLNDLYMKCVELEGKFEIKNGEEAVCKLDGIQISINKYGTVKIHSTVRLPKFFRQELLENPLEMEQLLKKAWISTMRDLNTTFTKMKQFIRDADRLRIEVEVDLTKY